MPSNHNPVPFTFVQSIMDKTVWWVLDADNCVFAEVHGDDAVILLREALSSHATLAAIQSLVDEYLRTTTEQGLVGTPGQELCERIKDVLK